MPRAKQIPSAQSYNALAPAVESSLQPHIASRDQTATLSDDAVPAATMAALQFGNDDEFWNIKTVSEKTGLSRASIYRYVARNLFPARRRIGPGRIAWLASEVLSWMRSRPRPDQPR